MSKTKDKLIENHNKDPYEVMIEFLNTLIEYNKITIKNLKR